MRKRQIKCGYVIDDNGDVMMPGVVRCSKIDLETISGYSHDKRADVSFPTPDEDPMDWLDPLLGPGKQPPDGFGCMVAVENPHEQFNPRFGKVTYLADYPFAPQAEALMRKVALRVRPIMDEYKWSSMHLTEFYNKDQDFGENLCRGEMILLRLREASDESVFLDWEEILSTLLHELVHNWYDEHNGDFAALWYALNLRFGASLAGPTRLLIQTSRPTQHPKGHVSIFLGGTRIFLSEDAYKKHFSIWAQRHQEQDDQILQTGRQIDEFRSVFINRGHDHEDHCVHARLIQIARGLDPAVAISIHEVPNSKDFYAYDDGGVGGDATFPDVHDRPEESAAKALSLYLDIFRIGVECGMHASTKDWLVEQITHLLGWGPKVDGDDWHRVFHSPPESFFDRIKWIFPTDLGESSMYLGSAACDIYKRTTFPEGQCLRDIVIARMNELAANSTQAARYFDMGLLEKIILDNKDLKNDLDASVARAQTVC